MLGRVELLAIVLCALGLASCENAQSYCAGIYDDGGTTPGWAQGQFTDRESCVDWYDNARSQTY